jgi:hypothetical protein
MLVVGLVGRAGRETGVFMMVKKQCLNKPQKESSARKLKSKAESEPNNNGPEELLEIQQSWVDVRGAMVGVFKP